MLTMPALNPLRLALICGVLAQTLLAQDTDDVALAFDDACGAGAGALSACALSARQLRGGVQVEEAEPGDLAEAAAVGRRRRRGAPATHDITEAEEAKLNLETSEKKKLIANISANLTSLEKYENETRRMATLHPVVTTPEMQRVRRSDVQGAGSPVQDRPVRSTSGRRRRRRHAGPPKMAVRLRRVVTALDSLEEKLLGLRRREAMLERLDEWTKGKIDNPDVNDFEDDAPAKSSVAAHAVEPDIWIEPLRQTGPVLSKKHLEEQLTSLQEDLTGIQLQIVGLRKKAKATRRYYLELTDGKATADSRF